MDKALKIVSYSGIGLGSASLLGSFFLYTVDGGECGVMWNRFTGVSERTNPEGTHFRFPILQKPHIFDIRTTPKQIATTTGSKDLQRVNITLRVLYRPLTEKLPWIYNQLGMEYGEKILPSIGNEVMKAIVAKYNAEELITYRELVSQDIRQELVLRARKFGVVFDDISITELQFSKEFTQSVENKVIAKQEAERAKYVVMKAEQEKLAAIIRAEGESEAARLISNALKSGPGLIELRRIEASRDIARTLSKSRNVAYMPDGANILLGMGNK
eukprot:gb/GECH01013139.1/.p1 GENE.gb/GECH01013139.1/~~gb/GECH01013139.1/.p1  ORF type:complete len:272 (+),score=66.05 gb/GECH01013139.1/:1-816(+)